ncbi:LysR family transcriptional regulator [Burkholderia sp. Ap-962]|uniref:LysR family transcriptional regulator n=1 Tax=Burkholderia sp. Ap-962 TaxID=2608333 RepID=UPI00141F257D|nr:LysR family transcriptional regulator [Burkholderia sp. Ap-962]NIF70142.1 LysR family transcriptional regulator [Burkholderia sp. Ap-962]
MMDRIDIKHMRAFVKLVKDKNVSRVAAEAGLSQQAVSGYLKRLRETFKDELFLRQSNGLKPTDFAYDLCLKFERVLREFDTIYQALPFDPKSISNTFTVIANEYAQLSCIPHAAQSLARSAPGMKLRILDFDRGTHAEMLSSGQADVLIGFSDLVDDRLMRTSMKKECYTCVVSEKSSIPLETESLIGLSAFPHVGIGNHAHSLDDMIDDFFSQQGVSRNLIATLPCYTAIPSFLSLNDAVAFIPSAIAHTANFRSRRFDFPTKTLDVVLAWHRKVSENPLHKWAIETILSVAP